ncbi:hypothetical protein [Aggregatibacter kilianii]|uniref:hypothetical protein n=1 Tax=Aggregatibacter kilianii TaxID=2025884 RepID=UPI000D6518C1|nr:hypothetical protein [Aggregatibacter kilianii]
MRMLFKLFLCMSVIFLSACSSKTSSGDEKIMAVVTAPNGNLYVLTETLDYEFPKSKGKDIKLFFELSPVFAEIGQPISARMWVKERSVDFSFNDAILSVYKEENQKFSRKDTAEIKGFYAKNNKAKQLLKQLERMVKKDRSMKLVVEHETNEKNIVDYTFNVNKKGDDKIRGRVVTLANRKDIIKEYQSFPGNFKEYRINIFYEPSIVGNRLFGAQVEKEKLTSGEAIVLRGWRRIIPMNVNVR